MKYWHNPKCSKSREGLALLRAHGVEPEIVDYLSAPPAAAAIQALLRKLGGDPRQLVRFKEGLAGELGLTADDKRSAKAWATLLAAHPRLLERPVLEAADRAIVGRPIERLLDLR